MKKPPLGFVGLGIMGIPMAVHLARAGYQLIVHDSDRSAAEKTAAQCQGITIAETPAQLAAQSEIVITMVPNGRIVREIALGAEGLIEGFKPGSLLLDTSSSEPWITIETAKALAKNGVAMVDAPVSGAQVGAQDADLVFMAGGDPDALERVRPVLEVMAKKIFHLGPVGSGHMMKCLNNLITAMTFLATTEALAIGKQFSLDPEIMTDVLNVSTGMSWISRTHFHQRIFNRKFDDPFKLELMVKDIGIAMDLAASQGIPVPLSSVGYHLWQAAACHAESGASISSIVHWVEYMTGIQLTSGIEPSPRRSGQPEK